MSDEVTNPRPTDLVGDANLALQRDKDALEGRAKPRKRKKVSYLTINKIAHVDYKEVNILRRFLNDRYKIIPARQSGNTAKQQRMISEAIRRAREMALLPFTLTEMSAERRVERRPRYDRTESAPDHSEN